MLADDFYGDVEEDVEDGLGDYRSRRALMAIRDAVTAEAAIAAVSPRGGGGAEQLARVARDACSGMLRTMGMEELEDLNLTFPDMPGVRDLNLAGCNLSVVPVHLSLYTGMAHCSAGLLHALLTLHACVHVRSGTERRSHVSRIAGLVRLCLRSNNIGGIPMPFSHGAFVGEPSALAFTRDAGASTASGENNAVGSLPSSQASRTSTCRARRGGRTRSFFSRGVSTRRRRPGGGHESLKGGLGARNRGRRRKDDGMRGRTRSERRCSPRVAGTGRWWCREGPRRWGGRRRGRRWGEEEGKERVVVRRPHGVDGRRGAGCPGWPR